MILSINTLAFGGGILGHMNSIATDTSLGLSLIVLSAIFASMPLGLINVALAASKCQRMTTFAIHATLLGAAGIVAIGLMLFDLPDDLVKALARSLPIFLLLQTVVLFFRRDQSPA
jgi:hypothetical protein